MNKEGYLTKVFLVLIFTLLFFIVGCDPTFNYRSNNIELHVIATNTLLGVKGYENDDIFIFDKDEYGRVLFAYQGYCSNTKNIEGRVLALLISQKTTEKYSYFYEDTNYIMIELPEYKKIDKDLISQYFTDDQISILKLENDWNKELNEDKLFEVEIVKYKKDTISDRNIDKALSKVSNNYSTKYSTLLTTDKNGKSLYYCSGRKYASNQNYYFTKSYLLIFNSDGSIDEKVGIEELNDLWDYEEQLKSFKEKNNWNK